MKKETNSDASQMTKSAFKKILKNIKNCTKKSYNFANILWREKLHRGG